MSEGFVRPSELDGKVKRWYVINTYSGRENKVKEDLEKRIQTMNMQDNIFQVVVAEEKEIEFTKTGKKVEKVKNLYPGYVFVQMILSPECWYAVRNTPGVTGLLGSSGKGAQPFPVPEEDIERILARMGLGEHHITINFAVGDRVRILRGPFKNIEGIVEVLHDEQQTATISAILFGRETPTDVGYGDLEKID
ncbi:MAG: transcription termination/antitermination factor NusG [Erysipelotrichales bacterium]|nr:transcription termination/antitermination factor NusG [Erysipelotrichales bacterium]MBQ1387120.1 transcription termination/antitermination factor NusG [Erysipelotrichales bacterium]MBQ2309849.1 transcription termination/antitermination factor NusG [Erysipelotrichales bacterium]MBQ2479200.1 transcription termination/antitermination factor NusG [Erysipelotrichales bacterium]MBQ4375021.1 transcription termination/antitermination factor NusG [Erysipelotrichales bacterium]